MTKRKFRPTAFTRFLLLMLFIVPAAWFGASYYNGEDPVATIKDLLKIEQKDVPTTNIPDDYRNEKENRTPSVEILSENELNLRKKVQKLEDELNYQKRKNQENIKLIEQLKKEIWKKDQIIESK